MHLDGRVIVDVMDPQAVLSPEGAREIQRVTVELAGGAPVAVLVDMREMEFAGRDARGMFSDDLGGVEVATALLVSSDTSIASQVGRVRRASRVDWHGWGNLKLVFQRETP